MRAAVVQAPGDLAIAELPDPAPPMPLAATAQALERSRRGAGLKTRVQLRGGAS
jgi:hypothetical protein